MTERHEDAATWAKRPMTTGEFRATPDASASTAQFRAFAEGEQERPWEMAAPGRSVAKMALLVVAVAAALAVIAILVVTLA
jgi:hypothetical protein